MRLGHIDRIRAIAVLCMVEVHTAAILPSRDYRGPPSGFRRRCFRRDGRTAFRHHFRMGNVQERVKKGRGGAHLLPMGEVDYP